MPILRLAAAAVAFTFIGAASNAASFPGIVVDRSVEVSADPAPLVNLFGTFTAGPVAPSANSAITPVDTGLLLSIAGVIAPDLGITPLGGELSISDAAETWLTGDLASVRYTEDSAGNDTIHLLFSGITGKAAGEFGNRAVATIVGEFGADPFGMSAMLSSGVQGSVTVEGAAVIPLPASGLFLLAGICTFGAVARRHRSG